MSKVVVRMEMPQDGVCDGCDARTVDSLAGPICAIKKKFLGSSRPSWCPIICKLPEGHGRLIDASYVIDVMQDELDNDVPITVDDCFQIGCKIPTIVPAEREVQDDKNN